MFSLKGSCQCKLYTLHVTTLDSLCYLDTCFAKEVALLHTGDIQGGDLGVVRPGEVSLRYVQYKTYKHLLVKLPTSLYHLVAGGLLH